MYLSQEEQNGIKELYGKLNNLYQEKAKLEVLKRVREKKLKEEVASVCQIKNKQGEIQASKVKMPLINAILDELYRKQHNKKEEEISIYEEYKQVFKNKEINEDCITAYLSIDESIQENMCFIKEAEKEAIIPKQVLEALNMLLKDEYAIHLEYELNQNGYESKKKDDTENLILLDLKDNLKDLLNKKEEIK